MQYIKPYQIPATMTDPPNIRIIVNLDIAKYFVFNLCVYFFISTIIHNPHKTKDKRFKVSSIVFVFFFLGMIYTGFVSSSSYAQENFSHSTLTHVLSVLLRNILSLIRFGRFQSF